VLLQIIQPQHGLIFNLSLVEARTPYSD